MHIATYQYFLGCLSGGRAHVDTSRCGRGATQAGCLRKEDENKTKLKGCLVRRVQFMLLVLGLLPQKSPRSWYFAPLSEQLVVQGFAKSKRAVNVGAWLEKGR